jgi:hypothetical protein
MSEQDTTTSRPSTEAKKQQPPQEIKYRLRPEETMVIPIDQIHQGANELRYSQEGDNDVSVAGASGLGAGSLNSQTGTATKLETRTILPERPNDGHPVSERPDKITPKSVSPSGITYPIRLGEGVQVTPYINPLGKFDVGVVVKVNLGSPPLPKREIVNQQDENFDAARNLGMHGLVQNFRVQQSIRMNDDGKGNVVIHRPAKLEAVPATVENTSNEPTTRNSQSLQGVQELSVETLNLIKRVPVATIKQEGIDVSDKPVQPNQGLPKVPQLEGTAPKR